MLKHVLLARNLRTLEFCSEVNSKSKLFIDGNIRYNDLLWSADRSSLPLPQTVHFQSYYNYQERPRDLPEAEKEIKNIQRQNKAQNKL